MGKQIDVLAVMNADLGVMRSCEFAAEGGSELTQWGCCPVCSGADWKGHRDDCSLAAQFEKHQAARAAIAELIEADREYDRANRSEADSDGLLWRERARARRRAALAAVEGEK